MVSDEADVTDGGPLGRIGAYLSRRNAVTLAYVDGDGPQACAVFYALAGAGTGDVPRLHFVSSAGTRHGAAFAAEPEVAFTVQEDAQQWTSLTGVQGRGAVRRLEGEERDRAYDGYLAAFPFVAASPPLRDALGRSALWELTPGWLRLIDNSRGFGHKEEWPPR